MIKISKVDPEHIEALKKLMMMEGLNYDDVSLCLSTLFVVEEREDVLGFGYYNVYGNDIYIDHLYIKESERLNKLGDSLFRAILNSLNIQGVTEVLMRNIDLYSAFLDAEAIEKTDEKIYTIDLIEFFNRKCKSAKLARTPLN